jgi:quercetin dioxygenase-like cupin family protein
MNRLNPTISRTTRVAGASAVLAAFAWSAVSAAAPSTTEPPTTQPPTPPIAVEELTRIDENTLVRGSVPDAVSASVTIGREGMDDVVIDIADLSHVAVARFTIQPGAQFPWHTHPGPVLVTVTHGELVYVMAEGCSEHPYPAGTAFVDPGRGMVHSAYNPTDGETVIVATFMEVPADGPLSITEGVTAPADNCGLPTSPPG